MPFLWGANTLMTEAGVARVSCPAIGEVADVGDLVSLSTGADRGGIPHAVVLTDSSGITSPKRIQESLTAPAHSTALIKPPPFGLPTAMM